MKSYSNIITKHYIFYAFITLFYLAMGFPGMRKLSFLKQNFLMNYPLSYSAVAVARAFDFFVMNNLSGWSLRKIIVSTIPIYVFGMLLQVYPNNALVAIVSSMILLVIRTWRYSLADQYLKEKRF